MTQNQFADLLVRIHGRDNDSGTYPVEARLGDGSFFANGQLALNQESLLQKRLDPQAYGQELFRALFNGPAAEALQQGLGLAKNDLAGLRLRLWISEDAAELHVLQWEKLYIPLSGDQVPLAASEALPFSRYLGLSRAQPQPLTERPLRILAVVANPKQLPAGLAPIDVNAEIENLHSTLQTLDQNEFEVTLLPGRTGLEGSLTRQLEADGWKIHPGAASQEAMQAHLDQAHVLFFLGHGHFRRSSAQGPGEAAIFMEASSEETEIVKDSQLVQLLLTAAQLPHLVVLAACDSGKGDGEHPFVGLAPKLVEAGVPAVVAMQDRVAMESAREFTASFLKHLLQHGQVDLATNQARRALLSEQSSDWSVPILFSRLEGNRLIADPLGRPPKKYLLNLGLLVATALVLTLWFYRHLYPYFLQGLVLGGSVALLGTAAMVHSIWRWAADEEVGRWRKRFLLHKATSIFLSVLFVAGLALQALTSSVYLALQPGAVSPADQFKVTIRDGQQILFDSASLSSAQPIIGQPFFFRFSDAPIQIQIDDPPIFEPPDVAYLKPWQARVLHLPADLQPKWDPVIHVVFGVFLSSNFPETGDNPNIHYKLRLKFLSDESARSGSEQEWELRRHQNFFLAQSNEKVQWARMRSPDTTVMEDYLTQIDLGEGFAQTQLRNWRAHEVVQTIETQPNTQILLEVLSPEEAGSVLVRRLVNLDSLDAEGVTTIFLTLPPEPIGADHES